MIEPSDATRAKVMLENIPEPLRVVIRDFLHVEWFEVEDLRRAVQGFLPGFKVDVRLLQQQFDEFLVGAELPFKEINALTSNEFESSSEARSWLSDIYGRVFQGE